jgi:transcriptional regulator with XRE-family HTH domain
MYAMPRKPKFMHPLRVVREATKLSQAAFGRLVGCKAVTIERLENGKLKIGNPMHERIRGATGVLTVMSIMDKPVDYQGNPYTQKSFAEWCEYCKETESRNSDFWCKEMQVRLAVMFEAASRPTVNKVQMLYAKLEEWLCDTAEELSLKASIEAVLKEQQWTVSKTLSYGEWRKNKLIAHVWGFKDDNQKKSGEELTITRKLGSWWPSSKNEPGFVVIPGAPVPWSG